MDALNINPIIDKMYELVQRRKLAPGSYARLPGGTLPNPYGCADAANILYTIGKFPRDPFERSESVRILQQMQDPVTGLFVENRDDPIYQKIYPHHPVHTTAHCMAALELFDAAPVHRAYALEPCLQEPEFLEFMEAIEWRDNPWPGSHRSAGLYVALNLGGSDTTAFNKRYFQWMWDNADPETGMWRKGCQDGTKSIWDHMGGSFHYLFNHEYAHMPLHYPEKMIDSCIRMYLEERRKGFGQRPGFIEMDWVYCLTRASQQTPHRFWEIRECLEDFACILTDTFLNADWDHDTSINDLHMLFGTACAFAELQRVLRGKLISDIPLKLVLDRRPFI